MFLTGHWRRSVLEGLTHWQPGAEAGLHAMPVMMLAEAGKLMMRRLWMPLWSVRRARRDVILAQAANGRAERLRKTTIVNLIKLRLAVLLRRTDMMTMMLATWVGLWWCHGELW